MCRHCCASIAACSCCLLWLRCHKRRPGHAHRLLPLAGAPCCPCSGPLRLLAQLRVDVWVAPGREAGALHVRCARQRGGGTRVGGTHRVRALPRPSSRSPTKSAGPRGGTNTPRKDRTRAAGARIAPSTGTGAPSAAEGGRASSCRYSPVNSNWGHSSLEYSPCRDEGGSGHVLGMILSWGTRWAEAAGALAHRLEGSQRGKVEMAHRAVESTLQKARLQASWAVRQVPATGCSAPPKHPLLKPKKSLA